jgi:hypothetical protein
MQKIHFRDDRADQKLNKKIHISNPGLIREDSILFSDQATLPIIPSVVLYESIRVPIHIHAHIFPFAPENLRSRARTHKIINQIQKRYTGMHAVMS